MTLKISGLCIIRSSDPTTCPLCGVDVPANTLHRCSLGDLPPEAGPLRALADDEVRPQMKPRTLSGRVARTRRKGSADVE